jgi:membrane protein DedA with SNARE-associated domain
VRPPRWTGHSLREPRVLEWIAGVVASSGSPGIAALMFAENIFPPIPSERIMPLAGFVAAGAS